MNSCQHTEQEIQTERCRRIRVSVWAYAYEVMSVSLVSDHMFDSQCRLVDGCINTGNAKLDHFFRTEFNAHTGMWIHKHPDLEGVRKLYNKWIQSAGD